MKKLAFLIFFTCNMSVFAQERSNDLSLLANLMSGTFSTEEQAKNDSDYYHISLQIIPIWKAQTNGYWFYVEQAMASMREKPYRQRVYHLTQTGENTFESAVYTLAEPLRFTGKPELVEKLTPDSLQLKDGCAVILQKKNDGSFEGSTDAKKCPSDLRGASYATSKVTITTEGLLSWDQGFDKEDKQVWGATKGGYHFKKLK